MNDERRKALAKLGERLDAARATLEEIRDELDTVKGEEEEAKANLPESLQDSERGQKMDDAISAMQDAYDGLDQAVTECLDAMEHIGAAQE